MKHYNLLIRISLMIVILDQITKYLVLHYIPMYETISIIPNFFNLTHIHNTGGAFGMFAEHNPILRKILFLGVSGLSVFIILYFYHLNREYKGLSVCLSFIFGGAIGNLIDRFRMGEVVDFLDVYVKSYHWPSFNVADSFVSVGVTILLYYMIFKKIP